MPQATGRQDQIVEQEAAIARAVAADLSAVLITHYPDADTLDIFRPGETDLDTVVAVNRAVAAALAEGGVRVFVQRADRAAFRRWMAERSDTPENRRAWRDRRHLLSGAAALTALGVDPTLASHRPDLGSAPGPLADRLVAAFTEGNEEEDWDEEDKNEAFEDLAHDLLASGRSGVLDLAMRKARDRFGAETAEDLAAELRVVAEGAEIGPSGWAELVALPVALPPRDVPDAVALSDSLLAADVLTATVETRFLPGWRSPDALAALDAVAIRRVLVDMVAGTEPRDLPPADTDDLAAKGFGILLGVEIDWSLPLWDEVAVNGPPQEPEDDKETPEDAARDAAFDRWRAVAFDAGGGCVPLALVAVSEIQSEIADFLEDAGQQVGDIADIRAFVAEGRYDAQDEEVVCRPEIIGDGLELSLYTRGGCFVSSMSIAADRMPAPVDEIIRLLDSFVPVVKDVPGR
jgi:hypothetical protein